MNETFPWPCPRRPSLQPRQTQLFPGHPNHLWNPPLRCWWAKSQPQKHKWWMANHFWRPRRTVFGGQDIKWTDSRLLIADICWRKSPTSLSNRCYLSVLTDRQRFHLIEIYRCLPFTWLVHYSLPTFLILMLKLPSGGLPLLRLNKEWFIVVKIRSRLSAAPLVSQFLSAQAICFN